MFACRVEVGLISLVLLGVPTCAVVRPDFRAAARDMRVDVLSVSNESSKNKSDRYSSTRGTLATNESAHASLNFSAAGSPSQTTIEEMAHLAHEAYPRSGGRQDVNDWKLQDQDEQYAIFLNKARREVVLGLRGIHPEEALSIGLLLKAGKLTSNEPVAKQWTTMAKEALSKARAYKLPITVVGHSLGGALTMLLASTNKDLESYAFNPCGDAEEKFYKAALGSNMTHVYFTKTDSQLFSGDLREALKNQPGVRLVDATADEPHGVLNFVSEKIRAKEKQQTGSRGHDVAGNDAASLTIGNAMGNDGSDMMTLFAPFLSALAVQ